MAGLLALLLGGAGFVANGQDAPAVSLRIREPWCNVFGGRAATFNVEDRGPVVCEVTAEGPGWPWLDIGFDGGGRLLVCGFAVIEKWDAGPTPRFLFAKMLEEVVAAAPASHSQEAHDEAR